MENKIGVELNNCEEGSLDVMREIIRYAMKEKKVKGSELANVLSVGKSSISSYLIGRHGLSPENIVKAFKYLGIWFTLDGVQLDESGRPIKE